eukprot:SAG31_NODE_290_length_18324_cov_33.408889_8_plen_155_part_00
MASQIDDDAGPAPARPLRPHLRTPGRLEQRDSCAALSSRSAARIGSILHEPPHSTKFSIDRAHRARHARALRGCVSQSISFAGTVPAPLNVLNFKNCHCRARGRGGGAGLASLSCIHALIVHRTTAVVCTGTIVFKKVACTKFSTYDRIPVDPF